MDSIIAALKVTPIPNIMVVAGIVFLLLAVAGQFADRIAMPAERQRWAVIIGGGLLILGMVLLIVPTEFPGGPLPPTAPAPPELPPPTAPAPPELPPPTAPAPRPRPPKPSPEQLGAIDQILATLPLASIAFNTPATLRLGHSAVIQLFLSMQHSIEQLQATISAVGEKEGAHIRVSNQMEARLSGVGFKIEAITPEIQAVSERDITEWKWEIEPTRVGSQYLHLTLSARLYVADNPVPRTVRTFEKIIEVSEVVVPWPQQLSQFAKDNWQWLWAAILIPVIGWIIGKIRQRRKHGTQDWEGSN